VKRVGRTVGVWACGLMTSVLEGWCPASATSPNLYLPCRPEQPAKEPPRAATHPPTSQSAVDPKSHPKHPPTNPPTHLPVCRGHAQPPLKLKHLRLPALLVQPACGVVHVVWGTKADEVARPERRVGPRESSQPWQQLDTALWGALLCTLCLLLWRLLCRAGPHSPKQRAHFWFWYRWMKGEVSMKNSCTLQRRREGKVERSSNVIGRHWRKDARPWQHWMRGEASSKDCYAPQHGNRRQGKAKEGNSNGRRCGPRLPELAALPACLPCLPASSATRTHLPPAKSSV